MTLPTSGQITNQYLYGNFTKPNNLLDSGLIRNVNPSNSEDLPGISVSSEEIMADGGPGRFALGSSFDVVKAFLDPGFFSSFFNSIAPGTYTKLQMYQHFGLEGLEERAFIMQQMNYRDNINDYGERSYIYNSMVFEIQDGAEFVVEANGTRYIDNFAVRPSDDFTDNFDFEGGGLVANLGNYLIEPNIDPSNIGRTFSINYSEESLPTRRYDLDNLQTDINTSNTWSGISLGLLNTEIRSIVQSLFNEGNTSAINNDKAVVFGNESGETIYLDEQINSFHEGNSENGIVFVGSNENDIAHASSLHLGGLIETSLTQPTILYGFGGNDDLKGGEGDDIFYGGEGNDTIDGDQGNDTVYIENVSRADVTFYNTNHVTTVNTNDTITITHGSTGEDTLTNVETVIYTGISNVNSNNIIAPGVNTNTLYPNDDGSSSSVSLSSIFEDGLNFNGTIYNSLYVNTNGNITFGNSLSTYTPSQIGNGSTTIIAPFWADVDTRLPEGGVNGNVTWDFNTIRDSFIVTWEDVGYYNVHTDLTNTFQLELVDQGGGNFEIIFRYDDINWTTGDASGGQGGLGGTVVRAGFSSGQGDNAVVFELPGSGNQSSALNWDASQGTDDTAGVWQFLVKDGVVSNVGSETVDNFNGSSNNDYYLGGGGNDILYGAGGIDHLYGGDGGDILVLGTGNDYGDGGSGFDWIYGGDGDDELHGGAGATDVLLGDAGNDTIFGEDGFDYMYGYSGNDLIYGGNDVDVGYGGDGIDYIFGESGTDWLYGENGADFLFGGEDPDLLIGGIGADFLNAGSGNDWLWGDAITAEGGGGADTFIFDQNWGVDVIYDFENGIDHIDLSGSGINNFAELSIGQIQGGFTWVASGDGNVIYLNAAIGQSLTASDIGAEDFIF